MFVCNNLAKTNLVFFKDKANNSIHLFHKENLVYSLESIQM